MRSFLFQTADYIYQNIGNSTRELLIVLPNRRGALFLKQNLAKIYNKTIWLPKIISIEEFISQLSGLQKADSIRLTVLLYECYLEIMKDKAESFDQFIKWSYILLQDFNEIDRYLVDANKLYKNLSDIKEIESWSLNRDEKSALQINYLEFMSAVGDIYILFTNKLKKEKIAYQGMAYRMAVESVTSSESFNEYKHIIFAGFNALNKSEEFLFSYFKNYKNAVFIWDGDEYYVKDSKQEAGHFLRKNFRNYDLKNDTFIENHFLSTSKNIQIIGAAQNMAQVAVASELIKNWIYKGINPDKTAIILCDEGLLFPLLNTLPEEIKEINVSLEFPLSKSTLFDFAIQLFNLHINKKQSRTSDLIYYKDILKIIQNPYFSKLIPNSSQIHQLKKKIAQNNTSYFTSEQIELLFGTEYQKIAFLFKGWETPHDAIQQLTQLGTYLIEVTSLNNNTETGIEKEFIAEFIKLINQLRNSLIAVSYINELKTVRRVLQQLQRQASIPFYGEPLKGLQIMGVLETRTLDFENVILISVNETVLPAGKSSTSFLPYDLKKHVKLPVFQDKDAIYAYHFYRLLQRASHIALIYNTETDSVGKGEKSRFITQLINELPKKNNKITIEQTIAAPDTQTQSRDNKLVITKTKEHIQITLNKGANTDKSGFSASLLNNYRDCSLRFYFNYITKIKEQEDVEENIETNTMGTILHEVLEKCYDHFEGSNMNPLLLLDQIKKIEPYTLEAFKKRFTENEFRYGKNYLAFQTVQLYATRLIQQESRELNELNSKGDYRKIVALEKELNSVLSIPLDSETIDVKITGICDRIDSSNFEFRIVDYKSSVSINDRFEFVDMDDLFNGEKNNKLFQLFIYAWLCWKNQLCQTSRIKPCIIPFKTPKEDVYYITQKVDSKKEPLLFTDELLDSFENYLIRFIKTILSEKENYRQTENEKNCLFCTYKVLCSK